MLQSQCSASSFASPGAETPATASAASGDGGTSAWVMAVVPCGFGQHAAAIANSEAASDERRMPVSCTMPAVRVHLIDGTFELFRSFFGAPGVVVGGREVGAARALVRNFAAWLRSGEVTHVGAAFDTVFQSFPNDLFPGYKNC